MVAIQIYKYEQSSITGYQISNKIRLRRKGYIIHIYKIGVLNQYFHKYFFLKKKKKKLSEN